MSDLSRMRKAAYDLGVALRQVSRAGDKIDRCDRCDLQAVSVLLAQSLSKLRAVVEDLKNATDCIFDAAAETVEQEGDQ